MKIQTYSDQNPIQSHFWPIAFFLTLSRNTTEHAFLFPKIGNFLSFPQETGKEIYVSQTVPYCLAIILFSVISSIKWIMMQISSYHNTISNTWLITNDWLTLTTDTRTFSYTLPINHHNVKTKRLQKLNFLEGGSR